MDADDKLDFIAAILTTSIDVKSTRSASGPALATYCFRRIKHILKEHGTDPIPNQKTKDYFDYIHLLDDLDPESEAS